MAAVADDHVFHDFVERAGVDADAAHRDFLAFAGATLIDLERLAGLQNKAFLQAGAAKVLCESSVLRKLAILAVDRQEIPRAGQGEHHLPLLRAPMARNLAPAS